MRLVQFPNGVVVALAEGMFFNYDNGSAAVQIFFQPGGTPIAYVCTTNAAAAAMRAQISAAAIGPDNKLTKLTDIAATPTITGISPVSVSTNSGTQTITLTGTGFTNNGNEVAMVNGTAYPLTYVSSTSATIALDTTNLTGNLQVLYTNDNGTGIFDFLTVQ